MLQNKVFAARGGREYFVAVGVDQPSLIRMPISHQMGFRSSTIEFIQQWTLTPTPKKMHELKLGAEVLGTHVDRLRSRAESAADAQAFFKADQADRAARALREYEADREAVKARAERERLAREAREANLKREAEERERKDGEEGEEPQEPQARAVGRPSRDNRGGHVLGTGESTAAGAANSATDEDEDDDEDEEEEDEDDDDDDDDDEDDDDEDGQAHNQALMQALSGVNMVGVGPGGFDQLLQSTMQPRTRRDNRAPRRGHFDRLNPSRGHRLGGPIEAAAPSSAPAAQGAQDTPMDVESGGATDQPGQGDKAE